MLRSHINDRLHRSSSSTLIIVN